MTVTQQIYLCNKGSWKGLINRIAIERRFASNYTDDTAEHRCFQSLFRKPLRRALVWFHQISELARFLVALFT